MDMTEDDLTDEELDSVLRFLDRERAKNPEALARFQARLRDLIDAGKETDPWELGAAFAMLEAPAPVGPPRLEVVR